MNSFSVLVNGSPVGALRKGDSLSTTLAPGEHELRLQVGDKASFTAPVRVEPNEATTVRCWFSAWNGIHAEVI